MHELELLYGQYDVYTLCEALDVSRGTFYNHILRQQFQADRPNQIWVSDVTCFKLIDDIGQQVYKQQKPCMVHVVVSEPRIPQL
ncbi:hypothetical protein N510_003295 [Firmicutes bacterium ASF500]|nr:hypothetical protein N510_003295 [Firmicutes bacterium ASF500]